MTHDPETSLLPGFLLDTNLIIEAAKPDAEALRRWIAARRPAVSAASMVEVLRYPKLTKLERAAFEAFFTRTEVLPTNDAVVAKAEELRGRRKLSTGDALLAATALLHDLALVTRNVKDFANIPGLTVHGPPTEDGP